MNHLIAAAPVSNSPFYVLVFRRAKTRVFSTNGWIPAYQDASPAVQPHPKVADLTAEQFSSRERSMSRSRRFHEHFLLAIRQLWPDRAAV
jgi:hypothetical protein